MTKTQTIQWRPFSQKHKQYIRSALNNRMCVAEGAIRSGKTIDHCIIFAAYLEKCPDRIHLASGSTMPNAKLNIGACNGFGLENLFRGRCRWGKFKDNEALYIQTQTGEKVVLFSGGGKADSYKRILGNSYGGWIATEINEHYDSDDSRESFIKVAFGRQAAADWPFVLWDLNPCHPSHKIYTDYIDRYKTNFMGGYQYQHFTIADNASITEERKRELVVKYGDVNSVWYRRDILGQRCIAEGLIYPMFDVKRHLFDDNEAPKSGRYFISVDYGTVNPFSAGLWCLSGGTAYRLCEYYYDSQKTKRRLTDEHYADAVENLAGDLHVDCIVVDPSAASLIACMRRRGHTVLGANNDVVPGIMNVASALEFERIKIHESCEDSIREFGAYLWDIASAEDKPIKEYDHAMDDIRYFTRSILRGELEGVFRD